jgi:hypothetical protein
MKASERDARVKRDIFFLTVALLLASCTTRPAPPSTDKVQTAEQAVAIAKAYCRSNGQEGYWGAQWAAGKWDVEFRPPVGPEWPFNLTITSADGTLGECRYAEY